MKNIKRISVCAVISVLLAWSLLGGNGELVKVDAAPDFWRPSPSNGGTTYGGHRGADVDSGFKANIYASESGVITFAYGGYASVTRETDGGSYGNRVDIDHGGGYKTRYAHLYGVTVANGQAVKKGELIGYQGCTGNSRGFEVPGYPGCFGTHLHFEILQNNQPNPQWAMSVVQTRPLANSAINNSTNLDLKVGDVALLDNKASERVSIVSSGVQPDGKIVHGIKYPGGAQAVALASRLYKVEKLNTGDIVLLDNNTTVRVSIISSGVQPDGQIVHGIKYPDGTQTVALASRLYKLEKLNTGDVALLDNKISERVSIISSGVQGDGQIVHGIKYPGGAQAVALASRLYKVEKLNTGDIVLLDNNTTARVSIISSGVQPDGQIVHGIKYPDGTQTVALASRLYKLEKLNTGDVALLDNKISERVSIISSGVQGDGQIVHKIKYPSDDTAVALASRLYKVKQLNVGDMVLLDNKLTQKVTVVSSGVQGDGQIVYNIKYPNGSQAVALASRLYA